MVCLLIASEKAYLVKPISSRFDVTVSSAVEWYAEVPLALQRKGFRQFWRFFKAVSDLVNDMIQVGMTALALVEY